MKLIQFCLLVIGLQLLPLVLGAQGLDFYYSPSRGTVVIDYDYYCDPCIFGREVTGICACEEECEGNFDACAATCEEVRTDLLDYQLCLDNCTTTFNECKAACGVRSSSEREYSHFTIDIYAYWAPVGQNPLNNRSSVQGKRHTGYDLNDLDIFRWRPPLPPWPEVYYTHNTCFILFLTLYFDDGTTCTRIVPFFTNYG